MKQSLRLFIFAALSVIFCAGSTHAEIFISELSKLDFAILEIPSGGKRHITVPADGGSYKGNGEVLAGMPRRGQYLITGGRQRSSISIDITNVSTGSPAIDLDKFEGIYNGRKINKFPAWGLQDPGPAGKILYLGAKLEYTNAVTEGSYEPGFDIIVVYE